jgi:guanine nucleotide-binding protein subunit alpha
MLAAVRDRGVSDSLTADPQPPPDEAPAAREARLASEREPKNVSDGIDEQVRQEKEARNATLKVDWKIYDVGGYVCLCCFNDPIPI